ncbi:MAG: hypothetical protein AVDCRST_MAG67-1374 [uncultured Solirubrobacteraceae bacterium]|uniref:Uncharacterized protein n=1 Tax=uncultured Solirubrobacteraceae bacterium TaxID=1162706 RepID=A0A6J4S722_9ACTN|nr:MAG: hypothetical protein AVDCRST_MAG67-1374 [uncultured Solirubrobacteraceae bacterium]
MTAPKAPGELTRRRRGRPPPRAAKIRPGLVDAQLLDVIEALAGAARLGRAAPSRRDRRRWGARAEPGCSAPARPAGWLLARPDLRTTIGTRDRALLELLARAGLRCAELARLTLQTSKDAAANPTSAALLAPRRADQTPEGPPLKLLQDPGEPPELLEL